MLMKRAKLIRLVGFLIAAVAFALPAVKSAGMGPGASPYLGWVCAVTAATATGGLIHNGLSLGSDALGSLSLVLSGWVNPLVVMYLLFLLGARFVVARRVIAAAILVCLIATWIFLALAPMVPLVGHFLWVGGIFLILAPELFMLFRNKGSADA
jgi:hypothetical protein